MTQQNPVSVGGAISLNGQSHKRKVSNIGFSSVGRSQVSPYHKKNKVNILVAPAILFPHGGCSKVEFHSRPWSPYVSSHIIFDSLRFYHNVKCTDTHMHIGEKPESVKGRSWSANLKALFTLIRSVVCIFLYQTQK